MAQSPKDEGQGNSADFLAAVGTLLEDFSEQGQTPILVGGMALVTLGSPRVTRDFDFLLDEPMRDNKAVIRRLYKRGFELATKLDNHGNVVRTLDNVNLAATRLRSEKPQSAYFYNHALGLRVDLLFDFPLLADDVRARATPRTIRSYKFLIADTSDLIRMKEIAWGDRKKSTDLQDLEFLKNLSSES